MSFGRDGALKPECKAAFPDAPWRCFMAPHMQPFIRTPFFMLQSKFDFWQLGNVLAIGDNCIFGRHPCNSSAAERNAVLQYGADFLRQIQPVFANPRRNGGFITSCICHYHCPYGNLTSPSGVTASELYGAFVNATMANGSSSELGGFTVDPSTIPNNVSFRQLPPTDQRCAPFR